MIEQALEYVARGWRVHPLLPRKKEPATKHGFKDATCKVERIKSWWQYNPKYNIGIATGEFSNLFVLDFDPKRGGDAAAFISKYAKEIGTTRYLKVATGGGGVHLYFLMPIGWACGNKTDLWPGVDVRANSGYVVAPGSIHPNGTPYAWIG